MSYLKDIDPWLLEMLFPREEEDEQEWFARVSKEIKNKVLESYRNGQGAGPRKKAGTTEAPRRKFPFKRKPTVQ